MQIEVNNKQFRLRLDAEGKPYVLKQLKRSAGGHGDRQYWGIVWANWHKSPIPHGDGRTAIELLGWYWDNSSKETLGWHKR